MNIYHIVFTGCDYDEYDAFVVIADNEDGAVELIKNNIPYGESVESVSCIGVSNSSVSEIVLGSFNAGVNIISNIEQRCDYLNQEIEELKAEILGEYVDNEEEDKLDTLIDIAMILGEAYVYRDNTVTRLLNQKMLLNHSKKIKEKEVV